MVDGGVSIAVRSVYPGKQARIPSYELLQEAIKAGGKEARRAQRFAAVSSNRTIANRANGANPLECQGKWPIFGRLVYLHVDKNTKRERLLVPGERIGADVMIGERVVALRPSK